MDLSIIIPCHNAGSVISPLLFSLTSQKLYSYQVELLFIIDTDTDNTEQLISLYLSKSSYSVKTYNIPSCTIGAARNYGVKRSTGEYIWFIDSDDWIIDDLAIFKLLSVAKYRHNDILMFNYEYPSFFEHENSHVVVWQYIFHRDFLKDLSFLEQKYDEDVIFMQNVFNKLPKNEDGKITIPIIPEKFYHYNYLRSGSAMEVRIRELQKKGEKHETLA